MQRFQKIQLSEEMPTERMNENPTKNQDPRFRKTNYPKILKIRKRIQIQKNPESLINQNLSV